MGADERRRARSELDIRAEMKSADLDEDTGQIEVEAISRAPKSSTPAPARGIVAVLNTLPPWGRVAVLIGVLALLGASGVVGAVLAKLGWVK